MATVREIAEPLAAISTAVPYRGDGVCSWCHGHPNGDFTLCYSCALTRAQVSHPCELVVPVSLYAIPSQLHFVLRHYKSGIYPGRQSVLALRTASMVCHFLRRHHGCIASAAGTDWERLTVVPSTSSEGEHPLATALRRVPSVFETYEPLLVRGDAPIGHNQADDDGYRALRRLDGDRVLLVDDTFTSGARAQSAASALRLAGARVVAIVPIGRVVNPKWGDNQAWWDDQHDVVFTFSTCCLEPF